MCARGLAPYLEILRDPAQVSKVQRMRTCRVSCPKQPATKDFPVSRKMEHAGSSPHDGYRDRSNVGTHMQI